MFRTKKFEETQKKHLFTNYWKSGKFDSLLSFLYDV